MSRAYLLPLLIFGLQAQTATNVFEKAPPDVEAALRDRVSKFYDAHVDRTKLRQTALYVAKESQDWFFGAEKPSCLSYKIDSIVYSDNFTKAKVVVFCKMRIRQPGFPVTPMDVPMRDDWKVEDGQWFWYLDESLGVPTPAGYSKLKPAAPGAEMPTLPGNAELESMLKGVQADKQAVTLRAGASDAVVIANSLPAPVTLSINVARVPGLKAKLDRKTLERGEKATLTIQYEKAENQVVKSAGILVMVQPLNQGIPIRVELQ